jgi:glycosyltransferase involved in cell wall biosynthesis
VNDASPDNCGEILREYAGKDGRIKIIDLSENKGAAAARNAGIDAAKGEYLGFVDSDDKIECTFFELLYICANDNGSDIAKGNICSITPEGNIVDVDYSINQNILKNKIYFCDFFTTAIYNRSTILKNNIRFYDGIIQGEDRYFLIKSVLSAKIVSLTNNAIYWYMRRVDSYNSYIYISDKAVSDGLKVCSEIVNYVNSVKSQYISEESYAYIFYKQIEAIWKYLLPRCSPKTSTIRNCSQSTITIYKHCRLKARLFCLLLPDFPFLEYVVNSDLYSLTNALSRTLSTDIVNNRSNLFFNQHDNGYNFKISKHAADFTTIPKILHYIWPDTDEKSDKVKSHIDNFLSIMPGEWKIKEWNPDNFDFKKYIPQNYFFNEVYARKMYAYISDYVRVIVLYVYGGVYVDTDIEIIKPFSERMLRHKMFLPIQNERLTEAAIWGSIKGHPLIKKIIDVYNNHICQIREFTLPDILHMLISREYGIFNFQEKNSQFIFTTNDGAITFYPEEYFIPFRYRSQFTPKCITPKTTSIHWFSASWTKNNDNMNFLKNKAQIFLGNSYNETKKVSVIIPVYNVEKYISKCLDSVIGQAYKNLEIICINDGSSDRSFSILNEYAKNDSRIKIVNHDKNRGLASARNTGLDLSTGDYVASVDSDDWIDYDYIKAMVVALEGTGADIVMNSNLQVHNNNTVSRESWCNFNEKIGFNTTGYVEMKHNLNYMFHNPFLYLYKRELLTKLNIRFPDGLLFEDCCFTLMLLPNINCVYLINNPSYHYIRRSDSIMSLKNEKFADIIKVIDIIYTYYKDNGFVDIYKIEFLNIIIEKLRYFILHPGKFDELKIFAERIAYDVINRKQLYQKYEIDFLYDILNCDSLIIFSNSIIPKWESYIKNHSKRNIYNVNIFSELRNKVASNLKHRK